ncbi:carbohydrate sulfotransferase 11-like [Macrobrachium nipponense]|uniref:carbohydrate sulfotransferase 11-like n=1 Tax=Macrobrachium nipponense TaxID=159736 RepID=UPI0030C8B48C
MISTYRKILFVRSPFERVVSAYRDKLEFLTGEERFDFPTYFKKLLNDRFGQTLDAVDTDSKVTFEAFVKFVISQNEDAEEDRITLDPHWRSIHTLCNPCDIDYDFIGKFEHLTEDSRYLFKWLRIEDLVTALPPPVRSVNATPLVREYRDRLSFPLRLAFFRKYILDYLSFDYQLNP